MKVDIFKNKKTGEINWYLGHHIYPSIETHKYVKTIDDSQLKEELKKLNIK